MQHGTRGQVLTGEMHGVGWSQVGTPGPVVLLALTHRRRPADQLDPGGEGGREKGEEQTTPTHRQRHPSAIRGKAYKGLPMRRAPVQNGKQVTRTVTTPPTFKERCPHLTK